MGGSSGKETEHLIPVRFATFSPYGRLDAGKRRFPAIIRNATRPEGSPWMKESEWHAMMSGIEQCFSTDATATQRRSMRRSMIMLFLGVALLIPGFFGGVFMSVFGCASGNAAVCGMGIAFIILFVISLGMMIGGAIRANFAMEDYANVIITEMPVYLERASGQFPFLQIDMTKIRSSPVGFSILFQMAQAREEALEKPVQASSAPTAATIGLPSVPMPKSFPAYWTSQGLTAPQHFINRRELDSSTLALMESALRGSFKSVKTRDRDGDLPIGLKLLNGHRVENSALWSRYERHIDALKGKNVPPGGCINVNGQIPEVVTSPLLGGLSNGLDGSVNEFYLFHGTSPAGALGVSETGFRLDLSGSQTGTMFGPGAYFAECCSKADEYAQQGEGIYVGTYAILLCRVACGRMLRLTKTDKRLIEVQLRSGAIDSVLGDREASVGTYREFVSFEEASIYPEFVLLYTREH